ncbi:MAG: hypothetical protein C0601_10995 [Candidatus Muiribacterium halophilum]|uniref:Glycosyl transferase family 1 domain-containing protein n=1 Tax=Muiribacterium halophilum TaxID=2053465 RepID=A0A2N5ZBT8_MUIH1|nr:MAG: hypothetical protein C0601_10995 [Candidatus Muirbacterium halophilum]
MNKKILILNPVGFIGGAEVSLLSFIKHNPDLIYKIILPFPGNLTDSLKELNIKYSVVYPDVDFNKLSRKSFNIFSFFNFVKYAYKIKNNISNDKFDIIYSNGIKMHLTGLLLSLMIRKKIVWHFRDILNNKYIKTLFYFLSLFTKIVICNSNLTAKQFPRFKTKTIFNSVENVHNIKLKNSETKKLAMVAHLTSLKNIDIAIDTMKYLDDDYTLHIFGEEPYLTQQPYKEILLKKAIENNVSNRVFFHGFLTDISKIYTNCDLFLTLSERESFGRTNIEALSYKKPILTTATGIFHKKSSLPFVLDYVSLKPESLSRKIRQVFDDYYGFNFKCNTFWMKNKKKFDIIRNNKNIKKVILC